MLDKITKGTIEGTKSAKDFTIKKWKRFIRKRALKRVEKLMAYAQKQPEDYTKEEMRKFDTIVSSNKIIYKRPLHFSRITYLCQQLFCF